MKISLICEIIRAGLICEIANDFSFCDNTINIICADGNKARIEIEYLTEKTNF